MVNILRNITAKINSHPSLKTEKVITVSFNHNISQKKNPNSPYTSSSKAQRYQLIPKNVDSSNRNKSGAQKWPSSKSEGENKFLAAQICNLYKLSLLATGTAPLLQ